LFRKGNRGQKMQWGNELFWDEVELKIPFKNLLFNIELFCYYLLHFLYQ